MKSRFINLVVSALVLSSCSVSNSNVPILVSKFNNTYLNDSRFKSPKSFIFIVLNPSECGQCEDNVLKLINSLESINDKTIILPKGVKSSFSFKSGIFEIDRIVLARYGLLNANGSVLISKNGICEFYKLIDVQNIDKLIYELKSFIKS